MIPCFIPVPLSGRTYSLFSLTSASGFTDAAASRNTTEIAGIVILSMKLF